MTPVNVVSILWFYFVFEFWRFKRTTNLSSNVDIYPLKGNIRSKPARIGGRKDKNDVILGLSSFCKRIVVC